MQADIRTFQKLEFHDKRQLEQEMAKFKQGLEDEIRKQAQEIGPTENGTIVLIEWLADVIGAENI